MALTSAGRLAPQVETERQRPIAKSEALGVSSRHAETTKETLHKTAFRRPDHSAPISFSFSDEDRFSRGSSQEIYGYSVTSNRYKRTDKIESSTSSLRFVVELKKCDI